MRPRYIIDGTQTTKPDFDILRLELAESVSENIGLQNYTRE